MEGTGEVDDANEAPFALAELPNRWIILFANDFEYVSDKRLAALSAETTVIGCHIHEGIMFSDATLFNAGRKIWSISHFAGEGPLDLTLQGEPPPEILAIRDRLLAEQRAAVTSDVDHVFDIPVEAAQLVTGYRYDQWKFDWGEPVFHVLKAR
jgi:hypothetical protein